MKYKLLLVILQIVQAISYSQNLEIFQQNDLMGIKDRKGKTIVSAEFEKISDNYGKDIHIAYYPNSHNNAIFIKEKRY